MRLRTWPVAAVGLASLLLLVLASVITASRRAQEIYTQLDDLNSYHQRIDGRLRRLRSDVHLSGIYVRDYLLDTASAHGPEYRQRLTQLRESNMTTLAELRAIARSDRVGAERIRSLESKLSDYWEAFEPLFDWTPLEKIVRSARFLRAEVLPRREAVLTIAQEIEELNNANTAAQREEVSRRLATFRGDLYKLLWQSLLLGFGVALVAVLRLRSLERRSELQRETTEEAERQMRLLSQQLVATQEEERKKLSRELHDHVGQMLTALRMELGRIDRLRAAGEGRTAEALAEARRLIDDVFRSVRDLSLGLRPSMLDDLGLQPAVEWHVRDFTRRYGIPVDLRIDGDIDHLPDAHRTCVYRVIQEALTNCARHSRATRINVALRVELGALWIAVVDNGVGLEPSRRRAGLGLRGIEERARELGGGMEISAVEGRGTSLVVRLPRPEEPEAPFARAAG